MSPPQDGAPPRLRPPLTRLSRAGTVVSFFLPQPPYLGKSKLVLMTSDVSRNRQSESIRSHPDPQLRPRNSTRTSSFCLPRPLLRSERHQIQRLSSSKPTTNRMDRRRSRQGSATSTTWSCSTPTLARRVANYSSPSRGCQICAHDYLRRCPSFLRATNPSTLVGLNSYSSPRLDFVLLDPDAAPTTFYDLGLATGPTSLDLPLLRMYRRGKAIQQVPLSETEARRSIRRKKREGRQADKRRDGIVASESESGGGSSDEDGASDESEDEREVAQERAMSRYKWDTSGVSPGPSSSSGR